jgi:cytosine/adenosine deaminase-related metal-dependent hydrolase
MAADLVAFDLRILNLAGAVQDPVAALLLCAPSSVAYSVVAGRLIVRQGKLTTVDLEPLVRRHNSMARALLAG